jgi:hypothetical protein
MAQRIIALKNDRDKQHAISRTRAVNTRNVAVELNFGQEEN